ncbi:MAG TPA: hypothetical protein VKF40_07620 [Burkholderiales bacterium]|nr:hypothetical protein [Burkholderiales bacterium]
MPEYTQKHPLATVPGALAVATWLMFILCAAFLYYPNYLASVQIAALCGVVACAAVVFNFKYWRAAVLLASSIYLLLYVIRVLRMTTMTTDSFLAALSSYYSMLWLVSASMFQEKGTAGGVAQVFLEYVMPVLVVLVIAAVLMVPRQSSEGSKVA